MAKYLDNSGLARVWDKVKSYVSGLPFVRYDSQSLSDAYKLQARTNIDAAKSDAHTNPNLLDNAYFVGGGSQLGDGVFPINQRGQTSYSGAGVTTFDRWICDYNVTATLQSGGVRVQISALYSGLSQIIPAYKMKDGETYTVSIIVDGTLHSATFTAHDDGSWYNVLYGNDWYVPYQFINGNWYFKALNAMNVDAFDHLVSAVKIEKGTVSTIQNDAPPNFQKELENCQHFLWVDTFGANTIISSGLAFNTSSVFDFIVPVPMRKTSIVATFTVTPYIVYGGNLALAGGATVTMSGQNGNHLRFQIGHQNNYDLGSLTHVDLLCGSETTVVVSAEL